jgi:nucleoside-diphosphate-sugar epimerase
MALHLSQQGVLNVFLGAILRGKPLAIYGDGLQLRDPLFIDDAVEAFLSAGSAPTRDWRVYNISGPESLTVRNMAEVIARCAGAPPPSCVAFPGAARSIDIGSYVSVCDRAANGLKWRATTCFEAGMSRTIQYYKGCLDAYLNTASAVLRK